MRIEKLTRSQKLADTFYVTFEDGTSLRAGVALIADFSLYTGRELSEEEYTALRAAAAAAATKARALRILGKRAMSRREITDRLVEKGEPAEAAEATADWLERIGAVDDREYAAMIARHYAARGYGPKRVRDELYRRGIDRELWDEVLAAMPEAEDKIADFLQTRLRGGRPDRAELKRATDALMRRGFSWDEIRPAVSRYFDELEEEDYD